MMHHLLRGTLVISVFMAAFLAQSGSAKLPQIVAPAQLIGNWIDSDNNEYKISIEAGNLVLDYPMELAYKTKRHIKLRHNFAKDLYKNSDHKFITDAIPLRLPASGINFEYKPQSVDDFGESIPNDIRELLLSKNDVIYHAQIALPYKYPHPSIKDARYGRIETVHKERIDDEKIKVVLKTPEVTMTRFTKKYISHTTVPDGEIILKRKKVCGPDVTMKVVSLIHHLYTTHLYFDTIDQLERCSQLTDPTTALSAWDITMFSPSLATDYSFRDQTARQCARPREPCGRSATFFGKCVNIQVLNYIQWGAMIKACGPLTVGLGNLEQRARSRLSGSQDRHRQWLFSLMGEDLVARLRAEVGDNAEKSDAIDPGKVMGMARSAFNKVFHEEISAADADRWSRRPEAQCPTVCELAPGQKNQMRNRKFSYLWRGTKKPTFEPAYTWGVKKEGKLPE